MKTDISSLIVAGTLVLAGCSSVKNHVDTGPIHGRTFSFINIGTREVPTYAEREKQAHAKIQGAITQTLAAKGLNRVEQGGDITVAYLIIVGNNATTVSLNEYFGYTADATALMDKVHQSEAVKNNERSYFEAGTLVIDMLDSKTARLLKRTTVQAQILRKLSLETREARLQGLVDQALSEVQIIP